MASDTARGFGRGNAPELLAFVPCRKADLAQLHNQQSQVVITLSHQIFECSCDMYQLKLGHKVQFLQML